MNIDSKNKVSGKRKHISLILIRRHHDISDAVVDVKMFVKRYSYRMKTTRA